MVHREFLDMLLDKVGSSKIGIVMALNLYNIVWLVKPHSACVLSMCDMMNRTNETTVLPPLVCVLRAVVYFAVYSFLLAVICPVQLSLNAPHWL